MNAINEAINKLHTKRPMLSNRIRFDSPSNRRQSASRNLESSGPVVSSRDSPLTANQIVSVDCLL